MERFMGNGGHRSMNRKTPWLIQTGVAVGWPQ